MPTLRRPTPLPRGRFCHSRMVTNSPTIRDAGPRHLSGQAGQPTFRVAIVSDLLEEKCPSMDLVADMLTQCLEAQPQLGIQATEMRPPMLWRLTRAPGV